MCVDMHPFGGCWLCLCVFVYGPLRGPFIVSVGCSGPTTLAPLLVPLIYGLGCLWLVSLRLYLLPS